MIGNTEVRDKASRAYAASLAAEDSMYKRGLARIDFLAGWDARSLVRPDQKTIARKILAVDMHPEEVILTESEGTRPWRIALEQASAILALFSEKGTS